MAKSYKSALPTWTTYTPYVHPVVTTGAINQENWWHNRARQFSPPSLQGQLNRIAGDIHAQVAGTGAAHSAAAVLGHRPLTNLALSNVGRGGGDPRTAWHNRMQEAVQQGTPETLVEPGEAAPQTPTQVRAAHTAPATVNPADVAQQDAARQGTETLTSAVIGSSKVGTASTGKNPLIGTRPRIIIDTRRQ